MVRTFIPGKVPALQDRLGDPKVFGGSLRAPTRISGDGEGEIRIWITSIGLGTVDRRMNFEADVEELSGKEISPRGPWSAIRSRM